MPRLSLLLLLSALSLSEGRALSRCELRDQLFPRVKLPSRSQRIRLRIMARVICEVERFSSLNTDIVREYKKEVFDLDDPTTTTTTTTTTAPTTAAPRPTTTSVERFSFLNTDIVREYKKEVFDLDDPTTTATSSTTTTTTTTTAPTTAAPRPTTTSATTAPEQQGTDTAPNPPPTTVIPSTTTTTTAPTTSPPRPPTAANSTSRTSPVAVARRRRALREERASVTVIAAKFFGIFQFSDRKYCNSGHVYSSEDKCKSDCDAFVDEDISNDLDCFVQSDLFWVVFRGASSACKSRRTQNAFFRACDAGETAPPPNRVVARVFVSGGNYK